MGIKVEVSFEKLNLLAEGMQSNPELMKLLRLRGETLSSVVSEPVDQFVSRSIRILADDLLLEVADQLSPYLSLAMEGEYGWPLSPSQRKNPGRDVLGSGR